MKYRESQTVFVRHPQYSWIKAIITSITNAPGNGLRRRKQGEKKRVGNNIYTCVLAKANNEKKEGFLERDAISGEEDSNNSTAVNTEEIKIDSEYDLYPHCAEDLLNEAKITDLLDLVDLHEATLLNTLKSRFFHDQIYTFIGPICIAMNPFKWSIPWYQKEKMNDYISKKPNQFPHFWQIADEAFRDMVGGKGNQCLLVSGNSGAGKTETVKQLIEYLGDLSCNSVSGGTGSEETRQRVAEIAERIKESSPILEAFGNAKTVNNDNSSRFGKFIKLQFDKNGLVLGANIVNYLLEKSRLIHQGSDERSYHIFYQLLVGATDDELDRYHLTRRTGDYECIIGGHCTHVESIDDKAEWRATRRAMKVLGLTDNEQEHVLGVVAALMHLQNVKFVNNENDHAQVQNTAPVQFAASILKVDENKLIKAMTTKTRIIMKKEIVSPCTADAAADCRNTISKALYSSLFDWLIFKINSRLTVDVFDKFIGLLDIFGFETFEINSFEQLCINFANEALQYHYNDYNFKRDIRECHDEGIDVSSVKFRDNTPCIELIQGNKTQPGILQLLDEQCTFPRSTDKTFLNLISKNFTSHKFFDTDRLKHDEFFVEHFADRVEYNVNGWLEKNKDELKVDILETLRSSSEPFIANLVKDPPVHNRRPLTVGGSFKMQLAELLKVINSTVPHWIRCIKSHPSKKPNQLHGDVVMNQLLASGVLETIKIRREGFCFRIDMKEFYSTYSVIISQSPHISDAELSEGCQKILDAMKFTPDQAQVGKTKVFLRIAPYVELKEERGKRLAKSIMAIQKYARMHHAKLHVARLKRKLMEKEQRRLLEQYKEKNHLLEMLREEKYFIQNEVARQIQSDNDLLHRLKEDTNRRVKAVEMQRLHHELDKKERQLEDQRQKEEEARRQKERLKMLEQLRIERELYEKMKREREMAEWLERERERQEQEAKRIEMEQLEREKEQQLILMRKRQKRIEERQAKLRTLREERERVDRVQQDNFLRAKEQYMEERRQKEMQKEMGRRAQKAKRKLVDNAKKKFAQLEEERLQNLLEEQEREDEVRRDREKEKRAYVEYVKKLKYKEIEMRARDVQMKEDRAQQMIEDAKMNQLSQVEHMTRKRERNFERVRQRQEQVESILEDNRERLEMREALQKISDNIRDNLFKKRKTVRVQEEWNHRRAIQQSTQEFKKVIDTKLYDEEMEFSKRQEVRKSLMKDALSPRARVSLRSPSRTSRGSSMSSPMRTHLHLPRSPRESVPSSPRRMSSPRRGMGSPRKIRISTRVESYSPRRSSSRRFLGDDRSPRRSPARQSNGNVFSPHVGSPSRAQIISFGQQSNTPSKTIIKRGSFSTFIK
eukprot:CAMPEP_0117447278 /NCGR_PEP_ID=MMETSP0759-20121206/6787_1 /TAXON_ID=63605 /ORGANISM="Percolomonas cosmopolitus, Strain WS" /LENGTH=1346 /DNA_ID=CAMNT_0005239597 /DNA_START=176 /DNA_END=4216 /DNA_ORIENTATION=-